MSGKGEGQGGTAKMDIEIDPAFLIAARAHGAALAHRVITWHGEDLIAGYLLRWKGLDEQAIEKLAPAFFHAGLPFDETALADLPPQARDAAENCFMAVACLEQARGLHEALNLLIDPEDEDGDPRYDGDETMDAIGALLADAEGAA